MGVTTPTFIPHVLPNKVTACCASTKTWKCSIRVNPVPSSAYIAYMCHLFVFPPTPAVPSKALAEATNLSLNFGYLIPALFPHLTVANHPMLEALFHIIVGWALLLLAFVSDSIRDQKQSSIPAAPFLIGSAFLTNILYLPYLALRESYQQQFQKVDSTPLLKLAESRALPVFSICLLLVSLLWGTVARPEFGDLSTRFESFGHVVKNDILAYSFVVDALVFSVFQAWLVPDDANRRQWQDEKVRDWAVRVSRIPFVGLAWYVFVRAGNASLQRTKL